MNKDELIIKLAEEFGISTVDIYQFVNIVVDSMTRSLEKGKNINISEFGKFKIYTRRDKGKSHKTISFSPVKKFAHEINSRYNDLSPTPLGLSSGLIDESNVEITISDEISEKVSTDTKIFSEKINPRVMANKDKYDGNIIRDDLSKDSSSESIQAFIQSKLDDPGKSEKPEDKGEFELPNSLIDLHNDITNKDEEMKESAIETPDIQDLADIENLINERKKALEKMTPDYETEEKDREQNVSSVEDVIHMQIEDRDKLEEFKNFEEERNAELSKIIAERNQIIEDIQEMVNNTDEIPEIIDTPVYDKPKIEEKPQLEEKHIEKPIIEEKPILEEMALEEDKTLEKKFQYEEGKHLHDNFDPIITDEDAIDYTKNDILIPEDTEKLKSERKSRKRGAKKSPKSFEDVFEKKEELEKQKDVIHSSQPGTKKKESETPIPPPPVSGKIEKPVMQQPDRGPEKRKKKMKTREEIYKEKSEKSRKKGYWIGGGIVGFVILMIYLAFNSGSFTPPQEKNETEDQNITQNNQQQNTEQQGTEQQKTQQQNNEQQKSEQQTTQQKENTPPPVTTNKEQKTEKTPESTTKNTTEQTTKAPAKEEITFDKALNVAFVNAPDGIYVQTASFKGKEDADKYASTFSAGNKKVSVVRADLGEKGIYFRVRIGKFASMNEAREFAGKLKK